MSREPQESAPQFYIGPDSPGTPPGNPNDPDRLLDEARERIRLEDEQNREGVKLARRLIVAFILILILGVVFYVVLPEYGLKLDPIVPVLSFLAILIGAVMTAAEESKGSDDPDDGDDDSGGGCCSGGGDGCAVGMCPGPRPLRMFRHPKKK